MRLAILIAGLMGTAAAVAAPTSSPIEEVVVRAHPLSGEGLAQPVDRLQGEELARNLAGSLGEVVSRQPGVATTFFGQAVGRPVIHGLGGPRVRVMEDRIASLDASVASDDHAVTVEPFLADDIEILKGPTTLVYGSGAIGGVVDVHTGRIPHALPDEKIEGRLEARGDDVADQRTMAARFDGALGEVAWHADGFFRRLDDYRIPGHPESAALRALEGEEDGGHAESDVLPNSDVDSDGGSLGLSWVGDRGFAGLAVSRYRSEYGLPGGHAHEGEAEPESGDVRLDLEQQRWDLEAALDRPLALVESVNVRLGANDYRHRELEGAGEVGTVFDVDAWEGRVELSHVPFAGWSGVLGLQLGREDFEALGEEAFTPATRTESEALFLLEERDFPGFTLQTGARVERVEVEAEDGRRREFDALSASLGVVVPLGASFEVGLLGDLASRAPGAAELFSDGPHAATRSYEIGDPGLDEERAANVSLTAGYENERLRVTGTAYFTRFTDFIYQADSGLERDGLPVRLWSQNDAEFRGIDLELDLALLTEGPVNVDLRTFYDRVHAELSNVAADRVPRLPPERAGVGVEGRWRGLTASVDYLRVMRQDRVAEFELPTDGYDDLRARVALGLPLSGAHVLLFLEGRNLTDAEQRNHVSLLKDLAPYPGRSMIGGVRVSF